MVGDYINEDIDDGGKNRDDHGYGDVECNNKSIYEYINDLLEWNKETEKKNYYTTTADYYCLPLHTLFIS